MRTRPSPHSPPNSPRTSAHPTWSPEGGEKTHVVPSLYQKFTAEIIGTAILVFIGAGSVPLTVFLTGENPFGSAELSTISFCFAFAISPPSTRSATSAAAHINPAVTIALLATRKIDSRYGGRLRHRAGDRRHRRRRSSPTSSWSGTTR